VVLRYFDGFDNISINELGYRWILGNSDNPRLIVAGRFGGNAVRVSGHHTGTPGIWRGFPPQPTVIVGAAVRLASSVGSTTGTLLQLRDGSGEQLCVMHTSDGRLQVRRGNWGGTVLATGAAAGRAITGSVWVYLELRATTDPTAGAFEVRVDGETWVAATGQNTRNTANSSVDSVALGWSYYPGGGGPTADYDDLYVCDATGATHNDFLGDVRVQTLRPTAAGASSAFALPAGQTPRADYRSAVLADSPLHFWELQETSGLTAPDTGTGTAAEAVFTGRAFGAGPRAAYAADFAVSTHATAAHTADMNITGDLTIECWAYLVAPPPGGNTEQHILARGNNAAWTFGLGVANQNSGAMARVLSGGGAYHIGAALPTGRWFHLAYTRAGTVAAVYHDAVLSNSAAVAAPSTSTNPTILNSASNGASPSYVGWNGRIAYLAVYGSALTVAQLRNHRAFAPWAALDDLWPDGDLGYAVGLSAGTRSTFVFEDSTPGVTSVKAVQVVAVARKDDGGLRSLGAVVRSGGTDYTAAGVPLSASYGAALRLYTDDPGGAGGWTKAGLDAAEFGTEVTL
jgi:Concanavalin A-like lectin/glucanases superfamily